MIDREPGGAPRRERRSDDERVVVTGMECVTPLGASLEETWQALCRGESAIHGGMGRPAWNPAQSMGLPAVGEPIDRSGRVARLALRAAHGAWIASGWRHPPIDAGCAFGSSKGDLSFWDAVSGSVGSDHRADLADHFRETWSDGPAAAIAAHWNLTGPTMAPVAACATGLVAIIRAAEWIRRGQTDVAIAGAADASLTSAIVGSFQRLGVLAKSPAQASPFSRGRSGFVIGEGAAAVVLERLSVARRRRAAVLAEVASVAEAADPKGVVTVDEAGAAVAAVTRLALRRAGLSHVDAVQLHGTGTRQNDLAEARGLRAAFGQPSCDDGSMPTDLPAAIAWKGQFGHLLGAAGCVEFALAARAISTETLPPMVIPENVDPACLLPFWCASHSDPWPRCGTSPQSGRSLLKLSLGFGGHLAAIVLRSV